ncbi:MAG: hypothetical protein V9E88_09445 [Ferruginibacter sp.]
MQVLPLPIPALIEKTTSGTSTWNTYSSFSNSGTIKGLGTYSFENTSLQQNGTIAPGNPVGSTFSKRPSTIFFRKYIGDSICQWYIFGFRS